MPDGAKGGQGEWSLALSAKRRKRLQQQQLQQQSLQQQACGGANIGAADVGQKASERKRVHFHETCLVYEIEDSGVDEFTFDICYEDGTPRVSQTTHRGIKHKYVTPNIPKHTVQAHFNAIALFGGLELHYPSPPRSISFRGRVPSFTVEGDDGYIVEEMAYIDIDLIEVEYALYAH